MLINPKTNRRALWRYVLVLPVAALLLMCSQQDAVESELPAKDAVRRESTNRDEVFTVVEQNPEPQGGMAGLIDYFGANLRYPAAAERAHVQGKVFVSFVVASDGEIRDVQILKGIGFGCDQEAVRVIKQMPNWKPGRQSGRAVSVKFNLPIAFTLEEGEVNIDTGKKTVDDFIANYNSFMVDGKVVDQATFRNAFANGFKSINSNSNTQTISMKTR